MRAVCRLTPCKFEPDTSQKFFPVLIADRRCVTTFCFRLYRPSRRIARVNKHSRRFTARALSRDFLPTNIKAEAKLELLKAFVSEYGFFVRFRPKEKMDDLDQARLTRAVSGLPVG